MKNFRIIDGQIYAGSSPSDKDLSYLKNILHINSIISLDQNEADRLAPKLKSLNIKHFIIPLDAQNAYLDQHVRYLVKYLPELAQNNQPTFIHCLHGQDRTGFAEAIYHIKKQNWGLDQTLKRVKQFGFGNGASPKTKGLWMNILHLLDQDKDIAMTDDYVIDSLRDSFRIDETGLPQGYQRGFLGPADVAPNTGLTTRQQKMNQLINIDRIPQVGVNSGLGPTRGFGPVEHSAISEFN